MYLKNLLASTSGILFFALLLLFAAFSATLIVAYFISLRPRRGTTEWMKRLDRPKFEPLRASSLRWSDLAWALLSGFCAAVLRLVSVAVSYFRIGRISLLMRNMDELLLYSLAPTFLLGIGIYLLLRSLFGQPLPAVCAALLSGLAQVGGVGCAAVLTASLLLLWLWASADADAPLFPKILLFLFSVAAFLAAVLRDTAVAWLSPIYLVAYVYAQISRWRRSTKHPKGVTLAVSLLLLFFLLLAAIAAVWTLYCYRSGRLESIFDLRLLIETVPQKLSVRFGLLFCRKDPLAAVYRADGFLFLLGLVACVPLAHGIIRRRDSRCIVPALCLPCFAAMWLFGGVYSAVPMLLPVVGYSWSTLTERKYSALMVCYAVGAAVMYFAVRFLH